MKKQYTQKDPLDGQITITIEPSDYKEEMTSELKKVRGKVQMKGFRKGKTPMGMVQKMYGPSVLSDILNKQVEQGLTEILQEEKLNILGQPITSEDNDTTPLSVVDENTYTFRFDVGISPDVKVDLKSETFTNYILDTNVDFVEGEMSRIRQERGSRESFEKDIQEKDVVTLVIKELEKGKIKKKGFESNFDVLVESILEPYHKDILGKDLGYTFTVDLYSLENNTDENYIKKHYLHLDEEEMDESFAPEFEAKVVDIKRVVPAEMNEEFLTQTFGEEVKTEEDAKEKIKEINSDSFTAQADMLLLREVQDWLMDTYAPDLPDTFLVKWLASVNPEAEENEIKDQYDTGLKKSFQWSVIKQNLEQDYEIQVTQQDVEAEMMNRIRQYMPGYPLDDNFLRSMLPRMMENKQQVDQVVQDLEMKKLIQAIKPDLSLKNEAISFEELNEKFKAYQPDNTEEE